MDECPKCHKPIILHPPDVHRKKRDVIRYCIFCGWQLVYKQIKPKEV